MCSGYPQHRQKPFSSLCFLSVSVRGARFREVGLFIVGGSIVVKSHDGQDFE